MGTTVAKSFNDNDKAKYNSGLLVVQTYNGTSNTKDTGFTVDVDCEIFSIKFTALKEITADSVIGVVEGMYSKNNFRINKFDAAATTKYATYDAADVDFTQGLATPASPVFHVQNQYRPNGANYDLGLKFGFLTKNIGIEFNEKGTSTNIAAVGATLKVNGVAASEPIEQNFVYDVKGDNSEYHFRVIISNVAKASTDKYEVTTYVKYTNGTIRYADPVTVTAADVLPA
jgi:hypothetical protein